MDSNNIPIKKRKTVSNRYINNGVLTDEGKEFLGKTFRDFIYEICDNQYNYSIIDETSADVENRVELFVWFLENCLDDLDNLLHNNMEVSS